MFSFGDKKLSGTDETQQQYELPEEEQNEKDQAILESELQSEPNLVEGQPKQIESVQEPVVVKQEEPSRLPTMKDLEAAQEERRTRETFGNIIETADKFGHEMTPNAGEFTGSKDAESFRKQGEIPLKEIDEKYKFSEVEAMGNPDSPISKIYREAASKYLDKEIPSQVSAQQLDKLIPQLKSLVASSASGRVYTKVMEDENGEEVVFQYDPNYKHPSESRLDGWRPLRPAGYAPQYRTDPRTKVTFNTKTREIITPEGQVKPTPIASDPLDVLPPIALTTTLPNFQKEFSNETKVLREQSASIDGVVSLVRESLKNPASLSSMQTSFAKLFETGVLTDADVKRYATRAGIWNQVQDSIHEARSGTISIKKAVDLTKVLNLITANKKDVINTKADEIAQKFVNTYSNYGIKPEDVRPKIYQSVDKSPKLEIKKEKSKEELEAGIKRVMDAHPGQSREEVIKELKSADKLPKDYK